MYRLFAAARRLPVTGPLLACSLLAGAWGPPALALGPEQEAARQDGLEISRPAEVVVEIGALTVVGTDLHLAMRLDDSPWMIGFRYLDYEDDFISIDADNTDEESQTISGPFLRYLLTPGRAQTWYVGGALYRVTQKIECRGGSDEDTANGMFFGGGVMGRRDGWVSYNIGLMLSPTVSLETDTGDCSSETDGGIDGVLSIMFILN